MHTSNQSVSLGGTAFKPRDNDDIVSQESPIFCSSDISKAEENTDDNTEGAFIENMGAFGLGSTNPPPLRNVRRIAAMIWNWKERSSLGNPTTIWNCTGRSLEI